MNFKSSIEKVINALKMGDFTLYVEADDVDTNITGEVNRMISEFNRLYDNEKVGRTRIEDELNRFSIMNKSLDKSILELATCLSAISQGDLTKFPDNRQDDPLNVVKKDLSAAIESIRNTLIEISRQASRLDQAVLEVTASTNQIAMASQKVAVTAQQTSDGMKKELDELNSITREVTELSASIQEIAGTAQEVRNLAKIVSGSGADAVTLGNDANTKMRVVETISKEAVDSITGLNSKTHEISAIAKFITEIANQTNLLALNAAIEAAHAGDQGRGFAVVAGEVRSLAGESKTATGNIEEVIRGIISSSETTVISMQKAYNEIMGGIGSVDKTIGALNKMVTDLNVATRGIGEISRATEDQAVATGNLTRNIDVINNLVRENEKGMEELAAMSEESSASSDVVKIATSDIKEMAQDLNKMVTKFKLN